MPFGRAQLAADGSRSFSMLSGWFASLSTAQATEFGSTHPPTPEEK
jgi:hypothetical protein